MRTIVEPVALALVHFIWQGALAGAALAAALSIVRRDNARLRYLLSCGALAVMLALPAATTAWLIPGDVPAAAPATPGAVTAMPEGRAVPAAGGGGAHRTATALAGPSMVTSARLALERAVAPATPWIFWLWVAGITALTIWQAGGWRQTARLTRVGARPARERWQAVLRRLRGRMGIHRSVRILESITVGVPTVVGWVRPVILVPIRALTGLTPEQIEALLAHELAHVRRHDTLVNLLQAGAETLLFYHPATWWVTAQIRRERENCCDDLAVAVCGDRVMYARALARMEALRRPAPSLALAASGGSLLQRIRRLSGRPGRSRPAGDRRLAGLAGLMALVALTSLAAAQAVAPAAPLPPLPPEPAPEPPSAPAPAPTASPSPPVPPGPPSPLEGTSPVDVPAPPEAPTPPVSAGPAPSSAADPSRDAASGGIRPVLLAALPRGEADVTGTWRAESRRYGIWLRIRPDLGRGEHRSSSMVIPREEIRGLTAGPETRFEIRREAGTFHFEGRIDGIEEDWTGRGTFVFAGNPRYVQEMESLGYRFDRGKEIFEAAMFDLTTDYAREIHDLGYGGISKQRLTEFRIHGVEPDEIRQWRDMGYDDLGEARLVELRIHTVTPGFAREMNEAGFGILPAPRQVEMRIHNVTPEFAREMAELGYEDLSASRLVELMVHGVDARYIRNLRSAGLQDLPISRVVEMKIHGVDGGYIQDLKDAGFDNLSSGRIVEMKIHGVTSRDVEAMRRLDPDGLSEERVVQNRIHNVTPELAAELAAAGLADVDAENLVQLKIHGVTPRWVREMTEAGLTPLKAGAAIKMKIHGVSGGFLREMREAGLRDLTVEDLVKMRIHGVTPGLVRELSGLGYDGVPVDTLVRVRIHGVAPRHIREVNHQADATVPLEEIIEMKVHGLGPGRRAI